MDWEVKERSRQKTRELIILYDKFYFPRTENGCRLIFMADLDLIKKDCFFPCSRKKDTIFSWQHFYNTNRNAKTAAILKYFGNFIKITFFGTGFGSKYKIMTMNKIQHTKENSDKYFVKKKEEKQWLLRVHLFAYAYLRNNIDDN